MNWALLERDAPKSFPGVKTKNGIPRKQKRM
jgi:hypothetical protein